MAAAKGRQASYMDSATDRTLRPMHPAFTPGRAAIITGAASGIGLAAAQKLAAIGMAIGMADINTEATEQVVDFMLDGLERGEFYILCPDNDTTRAQDEKRIRWAAEDIIQNRPALSRWHPDYAEVFRRYMEG